MDNEYVERTGRPRDRARFATFSYLQSPKLSLKGFVEQSPEQLSEHIRTFALEDLGYHKSEIVEFPLTPKIIFSAIAQV